MCLQRLSINLRYGSWIMKPPAWALSEGANAAASTSAEASVTAASSRAEVGQMVFTTVKVQLYVIGPPSEDR
jgi:hypothetical protein